MDKTLEWEKFKKSGKIDDYLSFAQKEEKINASEYKRSNTKGTEYRGI
ncbi:MAG: hypothetical protein RR914_02085 [Oscillospiraceae bacterium]